MTLRRYACTWACVGSAALSAATASAHDGPPYPIVVDHPFGAFRVSVWGDPDVGDGTFFLTLEADGAATPSEAFEAQISVQPHDHRLPPASHAFELAPLARGNAWRAVVPFDRAGQWTARFAIRRQGESDDFTALLDVTPPGGGPWSLLWYAGPFLGIAALWLRAAWTRPRGPLGA